MQASQSPAFDDCPDEEALWQYAASQSSSSANSAPAETYATRASRAMRSHIEECSLCLSTLQALQNDAVSAAVPRSAPFDNRYVLGRRLGSGASSIVYCAHDQRLGTDVALKIFREIAAQRITQELLLSRKITHENVCRVFDSGVAPEGAYLAMEYIDGVTLEGRMAQGSITSAEAEEILTQVLNGLEAAHKARVVHRDLKPQNILISQSGRVVITDFGLARQADDQESRARLLGTPAYWSPEQARGEPATFASDVYSFGVIAYQALCGSPYRISDPEALKALTPRYRDILGRCLAATPSERFRSAFELKRAFGATESLPSARSGLMAGMAGAGIVAALGLGFWGVQSMRESRVPTLPPVAESSGAGSGAGAVAAVGPSSIWGDSSGAASGVAVAPLSTGAAVDSVHSAGNGKRAIRAPFASAGATALASQAPTAAVVPTAKPSSASDLLYKP